MMGVLELIIENKEGDIHVKTKDGMKCTVSVRMIPELGMVDVFGPMKVGTS